MTVEQRESGIIGHKIYFSTAETVDHNDVFGYAPSEFAGIAGDFKTVAV